MSTPSHAHVTITSSPATEAPDSLVLVAAEHTPAGPVLLADPALGLSELPLRLLGVSGAADELTRTVTEVAGSPRALAIVGVGAAGRAGGLRSSVGAALRQLRTLEADAAPAQVAIAIPHGTEDELTQIVEGAALGGYRYDAVRGTAFTAKGEIAVTVHSQFADNGLSERTAVIAGAVARTKDLVNEPANSMFPAAFVAAAETQLQGLPVSITSWDEEALARDGFGAILGVGQGSSRGPRLLRVAYAPEGASRHIALVGKGITFDTGGLSLKPAGAMVGMKYDMTGAATVLNVVQAIAELGLPVAVTAWMPLAENMPSGTATRPGDVVTAKNGHTIEINNTDAEGRLVLADALVAASLEFPDEIIDIATLTGAQEVALGSRTVGLMGDDTLVETLRSVGMQQHELLWPMPLTEELRPILRSDIADIANANMGNRSAGMLVAAVFLREFIGMSQDGETRIPWAHLDIAGPAANEGASYGFSGPGATGVCVRTLIAHVAASA